eukprot:3570791-Rhodomonas_salina.1
MLAMADGRMTTGPGRPSRGRCEPGLPPPNTSRSTTTLRPWLRRRDCRPCRGCCCRPVLCLGDRGLVGLPRPAVAEHHVCGVPDAVAMDPARPRPTPRRAGLLSPSSRCVCDACVYGKVDRPEAWYDKTRRRRAGE